MRRQQRRRLRPTNPLPSLEIRLRLQRVHLQQRAQHVRQMPCPVRSGVRFQGTRQGRFRFVQYHDRRVRSISSARGRAEGVRRNA